MYPRRFCNHNLPHWTNIFQYPDFKWILTNTQIIPTEKRWFQGETDQAENSATHIRSNSAQFPPKYLNVFRFYYNQSLMPISIRFTNYSWLKKGKKKKMTPVRNCKNLCFEEPWDWDRQIINAMSPGEVNANKNFFFLTNPKKKREKNLCTDAVWSC